MGFATVYLKIYNFLMFLVWGSLLIHVLSYANPYAFTNPLIFQHTALANGLLWMDFIHSILRISRTDPVPCFLQTLSRSWCVSVMAIDGQSWWEAWTVIAWCIAEMIRDINYIHTNSILTWLRYSAFIVLYPGGVFGEWMNVWDKWPAISACCPRIYSIALPNALNFSFDFAWSIIGFWLPAYAVGFPFLYSHMLKLRSIKLSSDKSKRE